MSNFNEKKNSKLSTWFGANLTDLDISPRKCDSIHSSSVYLKFPWISYKPDSLQILALHFSSRFQKIIKLYKDVMPLPYMSCLSFIFLRTHTWSFANPKRCIFSLQFQKIIREKRFIFTSCLFSGLYLYQISMRKNPKLSTMFGANLTYPHK